MGINFQENVRDFLYDLKSHNQSQMKVHYQHWASYESQEHFLSGLIKN